MPAFKAKLALGAIRGEQTLVYPSGFKPLSPTSRAKKLEIFNTFYVNSSPNPPSQEDNDHA